MVVVAEGVIGCGDSGSQSANIQSGPAGQTKQTLVRLVQPSQGIYYSIEAAATNYRHHRQN